MGGRKQIVAFVVTRFESLYTSIVSCWKDLCGKGVKRMDSPTKERILSVMQCVIHCSPSTTRKLQEKPLREGFSIYGQCAIHYPMAHKWMCSAKKTDECYVRIHDFTHRRNIIGHFNPSVRITYITGHYNPSGSIIDLVSHRITTYQLVFICW